MNDDICSYIRSGCDFLSLSQKVLLSVFGGIFVFISIFIIGVVAIIVFNVKQYNNEQKADVEEYFETHYGDRDYVIDKMFNNYPVSGYVAKISSPSSPDTHFEIVHVSKGEVEDTYEEDVLSGSNTLERVEDAYNQLVNKTIEENDVDFDYSSVCGRYFSSWDDSDELFLNPEDLQLDKEYDVRDLGAKHGQIAIYANDEEIEYETVEQIMLQVKEIIDDADIPFLKMSVTLEEPLDDEDNTVGNDRMEFYGVPYEKIEEDGLLQYLKENEDTQ